MEHLEHLTRLLALLAQVPNMVWIVVGLALMFALEPYLDRCVDWCADQWEWWVWRR